MANLETKWSLGGIDAGDARIELSRIDDEDGAVTFEVVIYRLGREQRLRLRRSTTAALVALLGRGLDAMKGAA